ncbi:unnamed protein product, partial [Discosporangium mesarthrocarpum]
MATKRTAPAPAVVGKRFVQQYYGEVLSKKPIELHRFYKDESTFCHASGSKLEEPVSGLAEIKKRIERLGLGGATVDLDCGSVDAQPSEGGGVLLMVTGSVTVTSQAPRQFVQTFFLARQHQDNDKHNYFVRNDIFRFLEVLPDVVEAALEKRISDDPLPSVVEEDNAAAEEEEEVLAPSEPETTPQGPAEVTEPVPVPAAMAMDRAPVPVNAGAAPPSDSHTGIAAVAPGAKPAAKPADTGDSHPTRSPAAPTSAAPSPSTAATVPAVPAAAPIPPPAAAPAPAPPAPTPAPVPLAAPVPVEERTYASLAKSWANVAAGGTVGDIGSGSASASHGVVAADGGVGAGGEMIQSSGAPAAAVGGGSGAVGSGPVAPGAAWGMPAEASPAPALAAPPSRGAKSNSGGSSKERGSGGPTPAGIPHHASPAVAASAAAAHAAALAGNGEIKPATSIFVRKV